MEMPIDYGASARQVIDYVDVDKLLSNLQDYRDFAAKNIQCEMANNLQNAIMVIAAMRYELNKRDERWISTKDRMPEGRDPVLLYHKYGMCIGFYSKIMNMWGILGNPVMIGRNQIDYWRPLPEPPKKEDEQND